MKRPDFCWQCACFMDEVKMTALRGTPYNCSGLLTLTKRDTRACRRPEAKRRMPMPEPDPLFDERSTP